MWNAVVLAVDEKPHIQARERAQDWLKLPNGKALMPSLSTQLTQRWRFGVTQT